MSHPPTKKRSSSKHHSRDDDEAHVKTLAELGDRMGVFPYNYAQTFGRDNVVVHCLAKHGAVARRVGDGAVDFGVGEHDFGGAEVGGGEAGDAGAAAELEDAAAAHQRGCEKGGEQLAAGPNRAAGPVGIAAARGRIAERRRVVGIAQRVAIRRARDAALLESRGRGRGEYGGGGHGCRRGGGRHSWA